MSVTELRHMLGRLEASRVAVTVAPLHLRGLQFLLNDAVKDNVQEDFIGLSPWAKQDLVWWSTAPKHVFTRPIHIPPVSIVVTTDASMAGWGAVCGQEEVGGRWRPEERHCHINWLELRAVDLGLECFTKNCHATTIRLEVDNTTAVAFINRKGGTASQDLCNLAQQIWASALQRELHLVAVHVPGRLNCRADFQSRHFRASTSEWMLPPWVFQALRDHCPYIQVDLFAAYHNFQMPEYVSWVFDPLAVGTDAFSCPNLWEAAYAFPPFNLVGRCLQLVDQLDVQQFVLVAPVWPRQIWYPKLLTMLVEPPILLHCNVSNPQGRQHPMGRSLNLAVWIIFSNTSKKKGFQQTLQSSGSHHGGNRPRRAIVQPGTSGLAGVVNDLSVLFQDLSRM